MLSFAALAMSVSLPGGSSFPQAAAAAVSQEWQLDRLVGRIVGLGRAGRGATLVVDLIRADVILEDASADIVDLQVRDKSVTPEFARIVLRATLSSETMALTDIYPGRSPLWFNECLPPSDGRGDYWVVYARPSIVLKIPARMKVDLHLKEGTIIDRRRGPSGR